MSSDGKIDIIAIITPAPGKMDRSIEILEGLTKSVHANEPGCLRYQLHIEETDGKRGEDLYMIEQYKDQAALDAHKDGKDYKELGKIAVEEELLCTVFNGMMETPQTPQAGNTPKDLLTHSRFIRDRLAPLVANKGHSALDFDDISTLSSVMVSLNAVPMTLELLCYSRIDKALRVIATGSGWPLAIMMQAEELITKWELALGSLQSIHTDMWGPGGRLEGVKRNTGQNEGSEEEGLETSWVLDPPLDRRRAYRYGNLGFPIGAWWINPTAAVRDGIISSPSASITCNHHTAFAILMKGSQELLSSDPTTGLLRYAAPSRDAGVFKLMNTISASERSPVRVLRSCKLDSPVAPIGGLRYDGLYRVTSYGVSLTPSNSLPPWDKWHYDFTLQREPDQDSLEKALAHPIAEELDDWNDYQRTKAAEMGKASYKESRRTEAREMRDAIVSLQEMLGGVNEVGGFGGGMKVAMGELDGAVWVRKREVQERDNGSFGKAVGLGKEGG